MHFVTVEFLIEFQCVVELSLPFPQNKTVMILGAVGITLSLGFIAYLNISHDRKGTTLSSHSENSSRRKTRWDE